MKLQKLFVAAAFLGALTLSSSVLAAPQTTEAIRAAARQYVPEAAVYDTTIPQGKNCIIYFRDIDECDSYKVIADKKTNEIRSIEIVNDLPYYSASILVTPAAARGIVLRAYPDAKKIKMEHKQKDKSYDKEFYDFDFVTTRFKVNAKVNPTTGHFGYRLLTMLKK